MFSCENIKNEAIRDKTIIPVAETVGTGEILNLSDYAKSVEYIPLETNDLYYQKPHTYYFENLEV